MDFGVLFAGVAVSDFPRAQEWYERFFGRPADVVAHETEQMWRISDSAWCYIVGDAEHAGNSLVAVTVPGIDAAIAELVGRGITPGPITREGDGARKAVAADPDGNSVAIIDVAAAG